MLPSPNPARRGAWCDRVTKTDGALDCCCCYLSHWPFWDPCILSFNDETKYKRGFIAARACSTRQCELCACLEDTCIGVRLENRRPLICSPGLLGVKDASIVSRIRHFFPMNPPKS